MEEYTKIIFALVGGLGLFIYGMQLWQKGQNQQEIKMKNC